MDGTRLRKRSNPDAGWWSTGSTIWSKALFRSTSPSRDAGTVSNLLRRDVIPHWGAKSIHEIKKRDVSDLISLISQRNGHAGYRLLKTLKTFFRWCVGRAVIDFSPAEGLSSDYRENSRDRVLTDQELAAVILGARQMPPPYGGIVEFLALTGQRREEVCSTQVGRTRRKIANLVHPRLTNQEQESPHRPFVGTGVDGDRQLQ